MQLISTVFKEVFRKKTNGLCSLQKLVLKNRISLFFFIKKMFFIIVPGILQWKSDDWLKSCWVRSVEVRLVYLKYLRGSAVWFWELCSYVYPPSLRTVHIMSKLVLSCTPPVSGVIVHYKNSPLHFGDSIKLNFARRLSFIHSGLRNHKGFTLMHS